VKSNEYGVYRYKNRKMETCDRYRELGKIISQHYRRIQAEVRLFELLYFDAKSIEEENCSKMWMLKD